MAPDDDDDFEDDLYDDEFDFVDDEDDDLDDDSDLESAVDGSDTDERDADEGDSAVEEELPPREPVAKRSGPRQRRFDEEEDRRAEPRGPSGRDHDARDLDDRNDEPREFDRPGDIAAEEPVEEPREPEVPANYRVHVYEYGEFKRTIDRPFTAEDAESFASEYNRTSKSYGRFAVTGKDDVKPRKLLADAKAS
ncbi:MAG: hypothetical protein AB7G28_19975 [Pirellulales bacterium]